MAHVPIREYDAKQMYYQTVGQNYHGISVHTNDLNTLQHLDTTMTYAIKPDHLFGKRADYGLVGLNMHPSEITEWIQQKTGSYTIQEKSGVVDTFLVEPMVPIVHEYYLVIQTARTCNTITFSTQGGSGIEDRWDSVITVDIPLVYQSHNSNIQSLTDTQLIATFAEKNIKHLPDTLIQTIVSLYQFFVAQYMVYLEINPLVVDDNGNTHILDMVAKVDDTARHKQTTHRDETTLAQPRGRNTIHHPLEIKIAHLDDATSSSLKCTILNPEGDIWLILGGGGASVVVMDTFSEVGLLDRIANYGEMSGNPDYDNNVAYIDAVITAMLQTNHDMLVLGIIGSIANFTDIGAMGKAIAHVFYKHQDALMARNVHVYVRRGGINDNVGRNLIRTACEHIGITHHIVDNDVYPSSIVHMIAQDIADIK